MKVKIYFCKFKWDGCFYSLHHCWTEKFIDRIQIEFNANDPKDSELCQNKMKPFEKEVEV